MLKAETVIKEAKKYQSKEKTAILEHFFKTGPGQYGAGDVFWGLSVPQSRIIAKKFSDLTLKEIKILLQSKIHEIRLIALLILVEQFIVGGLAEKEKIVKFYLKNTKHINNWDLVDLSASKILGAWLIDKDPAVLYELVDSKNLWERRIAIVATYTFIKVNNFKHTLKLAKKLLNDTHDLMHKASGWMLREVGKKSKLELVSFLDKYYDKMPRTMLRYAIEKFKDKERQNYLKK